MRGLSRIYSAPAKIYFSYSVYVHTVETIKLVVFRNRSAFNYYTSSIILNPPFPQAFSFLWDAIVEFNTFLKQDWILMSGGRTAGIALTLNYPVETYQQLMKEYLDYSPRQTLLLTYELMACLCEIIYVNKNCQIDYRNISSAVFVIMGKNSLGPQEKCKLTISDSMSCPTKKPSILTIDLSLVKIQTLKLWCSKPFGYLTKLQSIPIKQFPLERATWD